MIATRTGVGPRAPPPRTRTKQFKPTRAQNMGTEMDDAQRIERLIEDLRKHRPWDDKIAADLIERELARLRVDAERKQAALLNLIAALPDTRRMLIAREDAVAATAQAPCRFAESEAPAPKRAEKEDGRG